MYILNFEYINNIDALLRFAYDKDLVNDYIKTINWLIDASINLIDYNYTEEKEEFKVNKLDKCRASLINLQTNLSYEKINIKFCINLVENIKNNNFNEDLRENINLIEMYLNKLKPIVR